MEAATDGTVVIRVTAQAVDQADDPVQHGRTVVRDAALRFRQSVGTDNR